MKRVIYIATSILLVMIVLAFASCGEDTIAKDNTSGDAHLEDIDSNDYVCDAHIYSVEDKHKPVYRPNEIVQGEEESEDEQHHNMYNCGSTQEAPVADIQDWCIDELGEIIVMSGTFWEDWWETKGRFDFSNLGYWRDVPEHISPIYTMLLPTSGFENLDDIHDYLLQYYNAILVGEMLSDTTSPFIEYDNNLYMHIVRASFARPDWSTASHAILEQDERYAIVKTTVVMGEWGRLTAGMCPEPFESVYHFTFIDGRIYSISKCPVWG